MAAPPSGAGTARPRVATGWQRGDGITLAFLAALTYLPLLLTRHGRLDADTKQYLYLDPAGLLESAPNLWNRRVSGGTVTHQNIGYLWPMGPYYRLTDLLGVPDWLAQRLWMGSIMFAAAAGAYWLFRSLWQDRHAATVGAIAYGVTPFVLGHITGQSALLLPFAALPWLVVAVRNALRADPWRWAAVFALVTATAGSLNGSSIFFVLFGACLWIPYAIWWEHSTTLRRGVLVLLRLGALTLVTQLWWLMAYSVGGSYGLPILQVTETVRETSATTSAFEVLRGLGYWFFYGGDNQGAWLDGVAPPFTQSLALLAVSFVVPLVALGLGWWSRFRERAYFVGLVVGGLLISTVAFGTTDRSLVGTIFESTSRSSGLVLSLRNTQRAAALVVLGLAGLATAGIAALRTRDLRLGRAATAVVVAGAVLTFASPWSSALVAERYDRPEDVPQAWVDTAEYLDGVDGRAMVVPGVDFASYRWGHTLDPVLAGLTRTELVWRELLPMGGEAGADLVGAFDQGLQEGWFDPRTIMPVARALGVTHIVVANDLELERYRLPRPEAVMEAFLDPDAGLTLEQAFGPGYENVSPGTPIVDAATQRLRDHGDDAPLPQVAVFSVPGVATEPVTATVQGAETVVHGDGAGVLAAAAEGLLDPLHLPLLYGTDLATWPAARKAARTDGARHVVTDTARKQVRRYTTLRENTGATQSADGTPQSGIGTDVDASQFTGGTNASQSIAEIVGAQSIDASGYGNVISLLPEDRPTLAFDGDPRTSWRYDSARFRPVRADNTATLTIDLGREVSADHVDVVQPTDRPGTQPFSRFEVVLDGTRVIPVDAQHARVLDRAGTRVALDGEPFSTLDVRIPDAGFAGPVGIAELRIPGVAVEEVIRVPRTLPDRAGASTVPLAYVFSRLRLDPSEPYRMDPELSMRRAFTVPASMTFTLSGTAHLADAAVDTGCRSDLMAIDGAAVPVRITGEPGRAGTGRLALAACAGTPLTLEPGRHVLRTAPGLDTGIDLDRLALVSPEFAAAPSTAELPGAPEVVAAGPDSAVIDGNGAPYWVRLNQSANRGWQASAEWPAGSVDLGEAHTLDAFASGWAMTRGTGARATFTFTWPPQRSVDRAIAVSGLAALVCIGLVVFRRRRTDEDAPVPPTLAGDPLTLGPVPAVAGVLVVSVGAAFVSLPVGVALAVFAGAAMQARRRPWLAALVRVAPLMAVGSGVAYVWVKQARNGYGHSALWPSSFGLAHSLVGFGVLAFALLVLVDRDVDVAGVSGPSTPPGEDSVPTTGPAESGNVAP